MEYRKNEKGVALLLALGFAALLLVLIMGFATNALIERKVAANVGDKMEIKAIAKSAVNRALAAINYQLEMQTNQGAKPYDRGVFRFDNIVSVDSGIGETDKLSDADLEEYFHKLDTDRYVFKYRDDIYLYEYPRNDNTDYSYNGATSDAFVKYRRPQWQYVKNADGFLTGRVLYAVLPDMGRVYYEAGKQAATVRSGQSLKDFHAEAIESLSDEYFADTPLVMRAKKLLDNNKKINKDNLATRLFYLYSIESDSDINWTANEDNNKRNYKYLSGNNTYDSDMVYVFDMDRNIDDLFGKVEYLDNADSSGEKTVKEKQIAANLIEAFNPNVSEDVVHDGSFDSTTTFTGNRRTAYLNEFELSLNNLKVTYDVETVDNGDGTESKIYKIKKCEVDVTVKAELFNPYGVNLSGSKVAQVGTDSFKVNFAVSGITAKTSLGEASVNYDAADLEDSSDKYKSVTFTKTVSIDVADAEKTVDSVAAPNIKITAEVAEFANSWQYKINDKIVDFVKKLPFTAGDSVYSSFNVNIENTDKGSDKAVNKNTELIIASYQVKDARVNLNEDDWNEVLAASNASYATNIGALNNACKSATADKNGVDIKSGFPDTTGNKAEISLADLVYISRGEAEKTLDILNSDDKKLLDQLTTLKKSDLPQLIDINTRSIYLWGGLLSNIKCADGSTDAVASADVINLAKAISVKLRNRTEVLKRRSDFVEELNGAVTAAGMTMTDDQKNAVIGKIMALCKIEDYPEYFYMIVIAQGIRDNQSDAANKGKFDADDEVTTEVRYLVKLHRNNANKIKILSMEELID